MTLDGKPGWSCTFYNQDDQGNPTEEKGTYVLQDTRIKLNDFLPAGLTKTWTLKLRGMLTMEKSATYELGLTVAGERSSMNLVIHLKVISFSRPCKTVDQWKDVD